MAEEQSELLYQLQSKETDIKHLMEMTQQFLTRMQMIEGELFELLDAAQNILNWIVMHDDRIPEPAVTLLGIVRKIEARKKAEYQNKNGAKEVNPTWTE